MEVIRAHESKWTPAPRECATITSCDFCTFMIGGMNFEAIKDVVEAKVVGDRIQWERVPYTTG